MNLKQECKLSMYLAVKAFLALYPTITSALPNFASFLTAFLAGVTQIQTYSEQQMFDKSGIQLSKSQLKLNVALLAADCSRKMQAYARFVNNQVLLKEIKFSESSLKYSSDNELRNNAQGIYDRAQSNLAALATYGVSAATQTALLNAITAFVTAIPSPRIGQTDKKSSTTQLANAFATTDAALANIDSVVEIVRLSQGTFYGSYKSVRKIIYSGKGSLAVKGIVTDAENGDAIKGAQLAFVMQQTQGLATVTKTSEEIVKKTADKGGFYIKTLADGMYKVNISKVGYETQETMLAVSNGELSLLRVQLNRS
jgi:hypothetical protein